MSTPLVVMIPVKRWDRAKSRLTTPGGDAIDRRVLAEAFARDAIAAALTCPHVSAVYVITDQPGFVPSGTTVLPDEGAGDLNAAITRAEVRVRTAHPDAPIAAMCADLPCLLPDDLEAAAIEASGSSAERVFTADAAGTGTTMLIALPGRSLDPHFGPGSAAHHTASGAAPLSAIAPTLRRDVDTTADLATAVALGVGPHTTAVLGH